MIESVSKWQQAGGVYVWRYSKPGKSRRGWHFTGDPAGCASIIDLIERMKAAATACHRTLSLGIVTPAIWGVPNFGPAKHEHFEKLRVDYVPESSELTLVENDGRLELGVGELRATDLIAAFTDVSIGDGDFGIGTSDKKRAESWMFWWMPNINYHVGKRL